MIEFLSRPRAEILVKSDVLEAAIALEVLDALPGEDQKLLDFDFADIPDLTVVARVLDQYFVRAHGPHAVVDAVAAALRVALDAVERQRGHHGPRRPGPAVHRWQGGN